MAALVLCGGPAHAQLCAYVANNGGDSVSVIDTTTRQVIRTIQVGTSPTLVAVTPDGRFAYVTITEDYQNPGVPDGIPDRVEVIDTATGQVVNSIDVGDGPKGIAFTPNGLFAYVVNSFADGVSVIDTAAGAVSTTIPVGASPEQVAVTPDGASAYVTNFGSDTVSVIDTATNMNVKSIPTGRFPAVVAISPDGAFAYVSNRGGDSVSVIDVARRELSTTIDLGGSSLLLSGIGVTPNGVHTFVAAAAVDTLLRIDTATKQLTGSAPIGGGARGLAITPDGAAVYVANFSSDTVSVIDTTTLEMGTINVGHAPKGIGIAPVTGSCPPPASPNPTPSATPSPAVRSPSATPSMTRTSTATHTPPPPSTPFAGGCCFCPTTGGNDECADPQAGVCPGGCVLLANTYCIDPGTAFANCVSATATPTPTLPFVPTPTPTATPTLAASATLTATPQGHGIRWETLAPVPAARQEVGTAFLDGRIYVVGGFNETGAVVSTAEYYEPQRNAWSSVAPLPEPLHHVASVALSGRLYSIGGLRGLQFTATDAVYAYDPPSDTWTLRAPLPAPRGAVAAAVIDGRIYAAGGLRGSSSVGDFAVYDPAANRWTALPPLPTKRDHLGAAAIGGIFYAAGGRDGSTLYALLESYDPATNMWRTNLPPMPTARGGLAVAALGPRLYAFGGEGNPADAAGIFPQAEVYDVDTNHWAPLPDMLTPRHGTAAVALADRIVVPAGATRAGFGASAANEALIVGPPPAACAGDCNDDVSVTVDELDAGIALIFDPQATDRCALATFDADRSGRVTAAELLNAVNSLQTGCGRAAVEVVVVDYGDLSQ